MKRIFLFILTNLAVVLIFGIFSSIFGLNRYIGANGILLAPLLGYSLVLGFAGSIVSLLLSKFVAKWSSGVRVIKTPSNADEAWLLQTVQKFATKANIGMPEVGIYDGEPNAFVTGAFKNSALVAVSTGLLHNMTQEEVEAVLAHEVAHAANDDMVTMALLQGIINTFVIFLSRLIAYFIDSALNQNSERRSGTGIAYMVISLVLNVLLGFLGGMVVAWFSRQREFRADAGAAQLMGNNLPMIRALQRLGGMGSGELPSNMAAMGIGGTVSSWGKLFSTHPSMEERIAALQNPTSNPDFNFNFNANQNHGR